ncbi:MAG: hypothetical protein OXH91_09525 [Chloroflexota bacterium]|nr:hypothetical protein [Chloroflexota bacterium]
MITLHKNRLRFDFPDVHPEAVCTLELIRTLRIPDDGREYPLPPGFERFPLRHLDDHVARLPEHWRRRGGVLMPMHQAEAMWINFDAPGGYPFALKIATGKVCAVSGDAWVNHLNLDPQDYLVVPEQPWLDGYCVEQGLIRQFVAMPLGKGYTAEEQLTGLAEHGGLQVIAYPMKRDRYEAMASKHRVDCLAMPLAAYGDAEMGLAPGGRMRQEIYEDPYGLDAWDQRHSSRCFVSIANSGQWMALTGELPPTRPSTAKEYTEAGMPWFEYYGGDAEAIAGAEKLSGLKGVGELAGGSPELPMGANESFDPPDPIKIGRPSSRPVREFEF